MNQAVRRILIAVAVLVGGFLTLRLLDLLMVWSLYSWFFQTIRNASGMPDTLNGAFSIWLVAITLMLLPTFFSVLFWRRNPKKVALVVTAVSAWLVVVYFLSLPKEGRFFNPMTGKAMYLYFITPEGKIELFPLGYKFHPRYGTKLEWVTPELVKEMDRKAVEEKAAREREEKRLKEVAAQEKEREKQAAETALKLVQKEQELIQQRAQEAREEEARKERGAQARAKLEQDRQELAQQRAQAREAEEREAQIKTATSSIRTATEKPFIAIAPVGKWSEEYNFGGSCVRFSYSGNVDITQNGEGVVFQGGPRLVANYGVWLRKIKYRSREEVPVFVSVVSCY